MGRALGEVVFRDVAILPLGDTTRDFGLSSMVLLYSSFEEILYLDADVIALIDPTPLFDLREYKALGVVVWPVAIRHFPTRSSLWQALRVESIASHTIDNAVMVIHRTRHADALDL